jgi:hypothetical protein
MLPAREGDGRQDERGDTAQHDESDDPEDE